jgi:iron complex transport system substrate-binding protein
VIVVVDYGEVTAAQKIASLKSNPAFQNIDAVRNDRFVVLPYVEATPGPRNIQAIASLAWALHPEMF